MRAPAFRPSVVCIALAALPAVFQGCSRVKALRNDIRITRSDVDSLRLEMREMKQLMVRQQELLRVARAEQQVRLDELERDIEAVSGNLSESQARLTSIDEKTQELKKGWDEKARVDSLAASARAAEIESLFEVAMGDYLSGRRVVALSGFQDIINRFPDSPKAEEALYWTGECHYAQKGLDEAESVFSEYLKQYPGGKKVCGALLKLGLVYDSRKKRESRNLVWEKVIAQCPGTDEARLAQSRLKGK